MSITEAKDYVDIVIEQLREWGVITESAYGKLTCEQQEQLADKIVARSEE